MICVISGTNRPDSKTSEVSQYIVKRLKEVQNDEISFLDLKDIPSESLSNMMYQMDGQDSWVRNIQDEAILPSKRWIIITPEYNGSYAGVLKVFIDALSVREYNKTFQEKYVALVGISSGRAGNLRGMEHLTGVLQYLKMNVYHNKLPISRIEEMIEEDGLLNNETTNSLDELLTGFLTFSSKI